MRRLARNRPGGINLGIVAVVVIIALAVKIGDPDLRPLDVLRDPSLRGSFSSIYLGAAGLAGLTAGFSGVVIIFGLQGQTRRFQQLRLKGGARLRANWVSVVSTSFAGSLFALCAATWTTFEYPIRGAWTAVIAVAFVSHSALRLLWLLRGLADVVEDEDRDALTVMLNVNMVDEERERTAVSPASIGNL